MLKKTLLPIALLLSSATAFADIEQAPANLAELAKKSEKISITLEISRDSQDYNVDLWEKRVEDMMAFIKDCSQTPEEEVPALLNNLNDMLHRAYADIHTDPTLHGCISAAVSASEEPEVVQAADAIRAVEDLVAAE